jgi:hypothetical protein
MNLAHPLHPLDAIGVTVADLLTLRPKDRMDICAGELVPAIRGAAGGIEWTKW